MVKIEKECQYKKLNGTMSGEEFRQWRANLYDEASGFTDESASSLADYFDDNDMGGAGPAATAMPAGAGVQAGQTLARMQRLRTARAKDAYALIVARIDDSDITSDLRTNFFQDGRGALGSVDLALNTPIMRSDLKRLNKIWDGASIVEHIGINPNSVSLFCNLLKRLNSERPAAQRYGPNEMEAPLCWSLPEPIL